jgi:transcriptional regulator with XRE-family HTH domain/predicted transcriptional regulator
MGYTKLSILIEMVEMLDLLLLHKPEDARDARCWILAKGKNLRCQLDSLQSEVLKNLNKNEFTNLLAEKAGANLKITLNGLSVKEWLSHIEKLRIGKGVSFNKIMRSTGTSGTHWSQIQKGERLPYCRKFKRIVGVLGIDIEKVCTRTDFCLRSIDVISKSFETEWIPLIFISGVLEIYRNEFNLGAEDFELLKRRVIDSIEFLVVNQKSSKPIKAVKTIDENLAKIIGAFAADGSYRFPDMLSWEDEYEEQLKIVSNWFYNSFGVNLKIKSLKKIKNSFTTRFRNKIIGRYLEVFFDFYPKKKVYTVDEPNIIKKQSLEIRKAFASGALMFDGSVNFDSTVSFNSASKKFRDSIAEILSKDGITVFAPSKPNKKFHWNIYTSLKFDKSQLKKLVYYFEKDSYKWKILDAYINNFSNIPISELDKLFLKNTKIRLILNLLGTRKFSCFDVYDIVKITNIPRTTLLKYLSMLEIAKILTSIRKDGRKVYIPTNKLVNFSGSNNSKSSIPCPTPKNNIGFLKE